MKRPGGTLIMAAHRELESLTLDKSTVALQAEAGARLRGDGLQRPVVHAAARSARRVLRRRSARPPPAKSRCGSTRATSSRSAANRRIRSTRSNIASFTMGAEYDQKDARGFINLIGLPIQVRAHCSSPRRDEEGPAMKLWGGRFEAGPSEVFERFSGSLHFDRRLIDADMPRLAGVRASPGARGHSDRRRTVRSWSRPSTRFAREAADDRRSSTARPTKTSTPWSSAN